MTLLEPLLADKLRSGAIGGMDSVDGMVLFDTPANFSRPPYRLNITLRDLTGRKQRPTTIDKIEENLSPDSFALRAENELDDADSWKIAEFGATQ